MSLMQSAAIAQYDIMWLMQPAAIAQYDIMWLMQPAAIATVFSIELLFADVTCNLQLDNRITSHRRHLRLLAQCRCKVTTKKLLLYNPRSTLAFTIMRVGRLVPHTGHGNTYSQSDQCRARKHWLRWSIQPVRARHSQDIETLPTVRLVPHTGKDAKAVPTVH